MNELIAITGELVGYRKSKSGSVMSEIVHVTKEGRPAGPAENAFVEVETGKRRRRARYLSWINYFDIEYASGRETGRWEVVEPAREYSETLKWVPFGWAGCQPVPTIGDSILERQVVQD